MGPKFRRVIYITDTSTASITKMAVSPFTYPLTRPVPLKFLPILIFFGLVIVVFAVIFNFIAGGYDYLSTTDPTFSKNITFWYNRFIPHGGPFIKDAWIC